MKNMELNKLLLVLKSKTFDQKVDYFTSLSNIDSIDSYILTRENFLCYCIAYQIKIGKYKSIENTIKIQIAHLKQLINRYNNGTNSKGFEAEHLLNCEENLSYLNNQLEFIKRATIYQNENILEASASYRQFLLENEIKEYKPQFEKILLEESKIINPTEKISFLKRKKLEYLKNLSPKSVVSSGDIIGDNKPYEIFMDREISNRIKEIELEEEIKGSKEARTTKITTDLLWFKVGIAFANGEMEKLYKKHQGNATKIANEMGNKNYRVYITESISKISKPNDKNIFNSEEKIGLIEEYCRENGISIVDSFYNRECFKIPQKKRY